MSEDLSSLSEADRRAVRFARRFDLRNIIGTVFVVYGAVLLVLGALNGEQDRAQAAGISINLWTGAPMLLVGALFFLWARRSPRPVAELVPEREEGAGPR
ncbi:hypothetical protein [Kineococcus sp. SYSU DK005]|uniref:hypothetical protein n=1 Tax=Kineococcus sp. SYSU DK005 TaxID=3383126 RepID=UPI003D7DC3BB